MTVYNEALEAVGAVPRSQAHREGLLHQVGHCWILSPRADGLWIWFQRRAWGKADFPGYYDIAVGGHIAAGEEPLPALLREIGEEVGLHPAPEQLAYLGCRREDLVLGGFRDREAAQVFVYTDPAPDFHLGEEVDAMIRVSFEELCRKELEGAETITAWQGDRAISLGCDQWCRHPGEFEAMLLPYLRERGLCK